MMNIKYGIIGLLTISLASCLKSKNDFAGTRDDKGNIVTSIAEKQYINVDAQNVQLGFTNSFANFNFLSPVTEEIKFFTLHISQPRETKLGGALKVKIAMTALPGFTLPPAGAITIPAEYSVPSSQAPAFDFPVKFSVNKVSLNPSLAYGATFTITAVDQGVFSELDKTIDVVFNYDPAYNTSKYSGRYQWTSTVVDPAKQFGITNNTKPIVLEENVANRLDIYDFFSGSSALFANNLLVANSANTALFSPRYTFDATGKITAVLNGSASTAVTNLTLDAASANQITYTSNDNRKMTVKYSFTLTTTINSVVTPRTVTVTESYVYDLIQVFN